MRCASTARLGEAEYLLLLLLLLLLHWRAVGDAVVMDAAVARNRITGK